MMWFFRHFWIFISYHIFLLNQVEGAIAIPPSNSAPLPLFCPSVCPSVCPSIGLLTTFSGFCTFADKSLGRNGIELEMQMFPDDLPLANIDADGYCCHFMRSSVRPTIHGLGFVYCIQSAWKKWPTIWHADVSRWLTLSIHGCLWILLLVCLSVHLSVCLFTAFSGGCAFAKEGGSHYWEMAVAITCGYGGYLLPLLAAHSCCFNEIVVYDDASQEFIWREFSKNVNFSTHWGQVTHACLSKISHHWLRQWLVTCWHIVNSTVDNKFQWNINQNTKIITQENVFENAVGNSHWKLWM